MLLTRMVRAFRAEGRTVQRPERGESNIFDEVGEKLVWLQMATGGMWKEVGKGAGGGRSTWSLTLMLRTAGRVSVTAGSGAGRVWAAVERMGHICKRDKAGESCLRRREREGFIYPRLSDCLNTRLNKSESGWIRRKARAGRRDGRAQEDPLRGYEMVKSCTMVLTVDMKRKTSTTNTRGANEDSLWVGDDSHIWAGKKELPVKDVCGNPEIRFSS